MSLPRFKFAASPECKVGLKSPYRRVLACAFLLFAFELTSATFAEDESPVAEPKDILTEFATIDSDAFRHAGTITSITPLPDGRSFYATCSDGIVRQWDPNSQQLISKQKLRGRVLPVAGRKPGVVMSPDGRHVAVLHPPELTESDEAVEVTNEELRAQLKITIPVLDGDMDGGLSGAREADDMAVKEAEVKEVDDPFARPDQRETSLRVSFESSLSANLMLSIHRVDDFKEIQSIVLPVGELHSGESVRFLAGGSKLLAWLSSRHFQVWDVATGKLYWNHTDADDEADIHAISTSPHADYLVLETTGNKPGVWDLNTRSRFGELKVDKSVANRDFAESSIPDSITVLTGDNGVLFSESNDSKTVIRLMHGRIRTGDTPLAADKLAEQVNLLGSNSFELRERATERLIGEGAGVLAAIGAQAEQDAELRWRLLRIRREIQMSAFPRNLAERELKLDGDAGDIVAHPTGCGFAVISGKSVDAAICVCEIESDGIHLRQRIVNGRCPENLNFSYDGAFLTSTNGDGTISVYRVAW